MESALWDEEKVLEIISPDQKIEEDFTYTCAYYESEYGDAIINNFKFSNERFVPHGPQFRVSMYEPSDYYFYTRDETMSVLSELNYKTLCWLHNKKSFHINGFESIDERGIIESYVPRHLSNRTEYYIDNKYVGVYYSEIYQNEIVRLNNEWLNHVTDLLVTEPPFIKKAEN